MNRDQVLTVLYDLALAIGSEVRVVPLLTRTLQRLLYHTGFPAGIAALSDSDGSPPRLRAAVGDHVLAEQLEENIALPAELLHGEVRLLDAPPVLPGAPRYRACLCLPLDGAGVLLLLAAQRPPSELPLTAIFPPLVANLARAVLLCRSHEAMTAALRNAHDATRLLLHERERRFQSLFANMLEGVALHELICDAGGRPLDYRIVDCNPRCSEILGLPFVDIIGRLASEVFATQPAPGLEAFAAVARGAPPQRLELRLSALRRILEISVVPWGKHGFATVFTDLTERRRLEQRLARAAYYDELTRLPNRALLSDRLQRAVASARHDNSLIAVCSLDLDGFGPFNARHGHTAGNELLIAIARRLATWIGPEDTLARLGGDEFALLLTDLDDLDACRRRLDALLTTVAGPAMLSDGRPAQTHVSIGVTLFPADDNDADTLLRHADQAMYRAKQEGGHRFVLFDADQERTIREQREALARGLEALRNGEFALYYQPKVDMRAGRVIGAEALIRWLHPELGVLSPAHFLPLFEGSEHAIELGEWVIATALGQLDAWRQANLALELSINISASHFQQDDFATRLAGQLSAHPGITPSQLQIEVLETTALADLIGACRTMEQCRQFGVSFALDDFGTGYSSLTYLKRLPADVLKIDQSFVRDILRDPEDLAIVAGVIGLAQTFGRTAIAEGVETAEHGCRLLELGCELAQGYGIARPMPAAELPVWTAAWQPPQAWALAPAQHYALRG